MLREAAPQFKGWVKEDREDTRRLGRLHGSSIAHGKTKFDMSFLRGDSAQALERMFNSWLQDPNTVHNSWWPVFQAFKDGTATEGTWPVQSKEPKTSGRGVVERTEIPKKDIGVDFKMSPVAAKPEESRSPPAKSSDTAMKVTVRLKYPKRGHSLGEEIWRFAAADSDQQVGRAVLALCERQMIQLADKRAD
ncbi:hypothetical protein AAG570_005292 [Ranatra chinensis]|uniref:2-oxoglutarate dehydrogenase E1 component N-terminal domain-containing protein n=1 Tax=Ranatra chinensis TaxID=642074 RepID=A0ABD0Y015_9HEMI